MGESRAFELPVVTMCWRGQNVVASEEKTLQVDSVKLGCTELQGTGGFAVLNPNGNGIGMQIACDGAMHAMHSTIAVLTSIDVCRIA